MKRTILGFMGVAAALAVLTPSDAAAQRPMRVGIIGGYNMASVWGDDAEGADSRSGFDVGGLVQIPMGDMITVQPEVHYTQKGYSFEDTEVALTYVQVPVLFKAGLPLAEGFDFDFQFGPSLGFNVGCSVSVDDGDDADCPDDTVKGFDYGIIAGGSFAWAAGAGDVLVDVRYDLGLTAISDVEDAADVKNSALQFLIGYAFPL
ncbi:MAG TPA: porin family protein [Longimicrobiales bacterium]